MIKSIRIEDFQSHKLTHIDLDPGVNVIIGRSDSGKTSILRALNWVINNKPSGEAFLRHGSKETGVAISLDNDTIITRYRKNKDSVYYLNDQEFKAFGQDVPKEIRDEINIGSLNTQRQMDAPFLLSFTPGEVGRLLNEIVKLDQIDHALVKINRMVRATSTELNTEEARLESLITQNKELNYVSDLDSDIINLEQLRGHIKGLVEKEQSIGSITAAADSILADLDKLTWTEKAEEEIIALDKQHNRIFDLEEKVEEISPILDNIESIDERIERNEVSLKDDQTKLEEIMPEVCPLCEQPMP